MEKFMILLLSILVIFSPNLVYLSFTGYEYLGIDYTLFNLTRILSLIIGVYFIIKFYILKDN